MTISALVQARENDWLITAKMNTSVDVTAKTLKEAQKKWYRKAKSIDYPTDDVIFLAVDDYTREAWNDCSRTGFSPIPVLDPEQ